MLGSLGDLKRGWSLASGPQQWLLCLPSPTQCQAGPEGSASVGGEPELGEQGALRREAAGWQPNLAAGPAGWSLSRCQEEGWDVTHQAGAGRGTGGRGRP